MMELTKHDPLILPKKVPKSPSEWKMKTIRTHNLILLTLRDLQINLK